MSVYLKKKIQSPTVESSSEGLIITIKSLDQSVVPEENATQKDSGEKSDKAGEQVQKPAEPKDDVKKSDKAGEQVQKSAETKDDAKKSDNQIVDIKKDFSKGIFRIIVLTDSPLKDYKPYIQNGYDPKLYIEFKGKWEKPKKISYEPSNDIVKNIEINNKFPDKTKLVFYLREDIQIPNIEATSQGLIITIDKLE